MNDTQQLVEIIKRQAKELRWLKYERDAYRQLYLKATTDDPLSLLSDRKTERPKTQSES
jgi:hypothetical protein